MSRKIKMKRSGKTKKKKQKEFLSHKHTFLCLCNENERIQSPPTHKHTIWPYTKHNIPVLIQISKNILCYHSDTRRSQLTTSEKTKNTCLWKWNKNLTDLILMMWVTSGWVIFGNVCKQLGSLWQCWQFVFLGICICFQRFQTFLRRIWHLLWNWTFRISNMKQQSWLFLAADVSWKLSQMTHKARPLMVVL